MTSSTLPSRRLSPAEASLNRAREILLAMIDGGEECRGSDERVSGVITWIEQAIDEMRTSPSEKRMPAKWACGWSDHSDRCLRLDCRNGGPCEGLVGDSVRRTPGVIPAEGFDSHHPSPSVVASTAFTDRWIDAKVRVPCDGDDVLGLWDGKHEKNVPDVVHYYRGHWCEPGHPVNECEAPKFWMPLPAFPSSSAFKGGKDG